MNFDKYRATSRRNHYILALYFSYILHLHHISYIYIIHLYPHIIHSYLLIFSIFYTYHLYIISLLYYITLLVYSHLYSSYMICSNFDKILKGEGNAIFRYNFECKNVVLRKITHTMHTFNTQI